jgi:hypothetical protein
MNKLYVILLGNTSNGTQLAAIMFAYRLVFKSRSAPGSAPGSAPAHAPAAASAFFYKLYSLAFGHGSGLPPITVDNDCVTWLVLVVELIEVAGAGTQH